MYFLASIFITLLASAQGIASSSDDNKLVGYRNKIEMEQAIEQRLERILMTRIEKQYFDVSTELTSPSNQSKYINETQGDLLLSDHKITITLSLSDKVTPLYREELKKWLTEWTKNQYGPNSETQIISRTSPVAPDVATHTSKLKIIALALLQLQNLIGLALIAGVLYFITKKNKKNVKSQSTSSAHSIDVGNDFENFYSSHTSSGLKLNAGLSIQHNLLSYDQIKSLKKKIYWISSSNQKNTKAIMDDWRLSTTPSLKFAAYCESMAEFSQDPFEIQRLVNTWIPGDSQNGLPSQISELQRMAAEDQLLIYQEVYADLFSTNRNSISQGTSYDELITQVTDQELVVQFEKLSERSQFLLLSKLQVENKKRLKNLINSQKMTNLLSLSFSFSDLKLSDFNNELEDWKNFIKSKSEMNISLEEQIMYSKEMADLLNPTDKIHWIYQALQKHPEFKHILAPDYKNIALFNEWNPDHLKKLCSSTSTKELAAVIANLPFLTTSILNSCGDQTRKEIQTILSNFNEAKKAEYFLRFLSNFEKFNIDQLRQSNNDIMLKSVS